jgi:hypothetical protein
MEDRIDPALKVKVDWFEEKALGCEVGKVLGSGV